MKHIFLNGHRFAYDLQGTGPITVILETGLGAEAGEWQVVADKINSRATVFLYDRAGRGESDPPSTARDAVQLHRDLNMLLAEAAVHPPFLLVGHSFGGVLTRVFARRRRNDVRGLVLVESMHPRQFEEIGPAIPELSAQELPALTQMREFWRHGWVKAESSPELIDLPRSLQQDEALQNLGVLPLHVITAASFRKLPFLPDLDAGQRLQSIWDSLQNDFVALSPKTNHTRLDDSGHFVQRDAPMAIVEAIMPMLLAPD
ncbi:alpha/beta fold hydrolase [Silvibacterium acidisoli]|uniref:alpha/beta fold hydrolase n=1 Tax=Acidobacteriaceae bacterium ZG23-2 TaxID=2883246 RepID=UPI00406CDFB3